VKRGRAAIRSGGMVVGPMERVLVPQVEDGPCHGEEEPGQHGERYREATSPRSEPSKHWQRQQPSRKHQEEPDDKHGFSVPDRNDVRTDYRI
jgi:hypothetical protein